MLQHLDAARSSRRALLHGLDRLVVATHDAQELARRGQRLDRAGVEREGVRQVGPAPSQSQSYSIFTRPEHGLHASPLVEGEAPARPPGDAIGIASSTGSGLAAGRSTTYAQVGRGQSGVSQGIVGIEGDCLLEQAERLEAAAA